MVSIVVDNAHTVNSLDGKGQVEIRELLICAALERLENRWDTR